MTVSRMYDNSNLVELVKPKSKPVPTIYHRENRLRFAEDHLIQQTNFNKILWSDEKWFTLNEPDIYRSYWRHLSDDILKRARSQNKVVAS